MATTPQYNFTVNRQDLEFILKQYNYAYAATSNQVDAQGQVQINGSGLITNIGGVGAQVSSVAVLPYGLRTVDGTWNHVLPGQERVGAADAFMPRIVPVAGPDGRFGDNPATAVNEAADDLLRVAGIQPANFFGPGSPAGTSPTTYASNTNVFDTQPRIVSNLIVDQTANNPAAVDADIRTAGVLGDAPPANVIPSAGVPAAASLVIPNESPDIGLSPPFNGWMTFFGQFFDHGLDLIDKGGSGNVYVPLLPDDPLYVAGAPTNFMVLTRATQTAGPDGVVGTADDHDQRNTTTPFIDQNQTYTSHPSHQVFLREYVDGNPAANAITTVATGRLLTGAHGEGNWAEVKAQALNLLGIRLSDTDIFDVPLLATDRYGKFIPHPVTGFAQVVTTTGLVSATVSVTGVVTPVDLAALGTTVMHTGHAFLNDIAHNAVPGTTFDSNGAAPGGVITVVAPDTDVATPTDRAAGNPFTAANGLVNNLGQKTAYDNELLDAHFITGDGRGNENIGLTTVHSVFHSEHNRLVGDYKSTILGSNDSAFVSQWLRTPMTPAQVTTFNSIATAATADLRNAAIDSLSRSLDASASWNGELLFQAGRFVTEMQYQHLVFEEFARAVQPAVDPFVFSNSPDLNPAITAEFANVVYRFGHSMLNDQVARMDNAGVSSDVGLIQAFLNPIEFDRAYTNADPHINERNAIGDLVRGMTRQVGAEIDEFVVEALRNNLVGLPLDLATLNMARARDTGMPSFNEARAEIFRISGDPGLAPYTSWTDLAIHLKNPSSIINFIAAYGLHPSIVAETSTDGKRAAATALVMGVDQVGVVLDLAPGVQSPPRTFAVPADRLNYLNSTATAGSTAWSAATSGLNKIDLWIGGLAEAKNEFGGMLGSTFNYVFERQMENLQNGDRFYYLSRTQGTNMLNQLEPNTFAALVMRNSNLGDKADNPLTVGTVEQASTHIPGLLFTTPNYILEMDPAKQVTGIPNTVNPLLLNGDPAGDNPVLNALQPLVVRVAPGLDGNGGVLKYTSAGGDHIVIGGTAGNDTLGGGKGIDTLWGDGGNDILDGGDEADQVFGGDGDDIITDHGTPAGGADFLRGNEGDDVISAGTGNDLLFGGAGQDFLIVGPDFSEVFAGEGNDFILGGSGPDGLLGNEGDDWIQGGEGFDGLSGENSELFFNSPIIGHDVLNGEGNDTDYDGESGDDIMVQGPGIQRNNGMLGFDWAIHKGDPDPADSDLGIPFFPAQTVFTLRDRFDSVEALSGWNFNDKLTGTSAPTGAVGAAGGIFDAPLTDSFLLSANVGLINNLRGLLGLPAGSLASITDTNGILTRIDATGAVVPFLDVQNGGDLLIGGGGNDLINGKAGDDIIDGNAYMNVRLAFGTSAVHGSALDLLELQQRFSDGAGGFTVDSLRDLTPYMLAGKIDPGGLQIVREILTAPVAVGERDVALFAGAGGVFINPVTGAASTVLGATAGSSLVGAGFTITRVTADQPGQPGLVTVVDTDINTAPFVPVGGNVDPLLRNEGTDRLRGIEVARFTNADGSFTDITISATNAPPVGTPTISDTTPTQLAPAGAVTGLTASTAGISDADGIAPGSFTYQWQFGSGATWTNVSNATAGAVGTDQTLTLRDALGLNPNEALVGQQLRVRVGFTDGAGNPEAVFSQPTDGLGNFNNIVGLLGNPANATAFADNLTGVAGAQTIDGLAGDDIIDGGNGADTLIGGLGNDRLIGGTAANAGADILTGGLGADTMTGGGGADRFVYTSTADTGVGAGLRDIITDFLGITGGDILDLSLIDAIPGGLDDPFSVVGAVGGPFTAAGQIRRVFDGTNTFVQGNMDGNFATVEFEIQLNGNLTGPLPVGVLIP